MANTTKVGAPRACWVVQYRGAAGWANLREAPTRQAARDAARDLGQNGAAYRACRVITKWEH